MAIGRYLLHVVIAYIAYAVLYILGTMVLFADLYMSNADMMRGPDDPLMMYS